MERVENLQFVMHNLVKSGLLNQVAGKSKCFNYMTRDYGLRVTHKGGNVGIVQLTRLGDEMFLSDEANLEWCVARCGSKSGYHKDMSLKRLDFR